MQGRLGAASWERLAGRPAAEGSGEALSEVCELALPMGLEALGP